MKAHALRDRLLDANTTDVPGVVADMAPYRVRLAPLLRQSYDAAETNHDARKQLHCSLALLPADPGQTTYLYQRLLDAEPHEVSVIRDALDPHKQALVGNLWSIAEHPIKGKEHQRLRAASALATYDQDSPRWATLLNPVATDMVAVPSVYLAQWMVLLRPIRSRLIGPMSDMFRDTRRRETDRSRATDVLVDYASDQPLVLADLLMDAEKTQFAVIFAKLQSVDSETAVEVFRGCVATAARPLATEFDKERLGKRQANAALALPNLGRAQNACQL